MYALALSKNGRAEYMLKTNTLCEAKYMSSVLEETFRNNLKEYRMIYPKMAVEIIYLGEIEDKTNFLGDKIQNVYDMTIPIKEQRELYPMTEVKGVIIGQRETFNRTFNKTMKEFHEKSDSILKEARNREKQLKENLKPNIIK